MYSQAASGSCTECSLFWEQQGVGLMDQRDDLGQRFSQAARA